MTHFFQRNTRNYLSLLYRVLVRVKVNRREPGTLQTPHLWQLLFPSALSCSPLLGTWLFHYLLDLEISRLLRSLTSKPLTQAAIWIQFLHEREDMQEAKVPKHKPSTLCLNHLHSCSCLSWRPASHYQWENCLSKDSEPLARADKVVVSAVWAAGCEFHPPVGRTCSIRIFKNNVSTL